MKVTNHTSKKEINSALIAMQVGESKRTELMRNMCLGEPAQSIVEEARAYIAEREKKLREAQSMAINILSRRIA